MPEDLHLFQAFIDFEASQAERERTRHLYERLLERTGHVKVRPGLTESWLQEAYIPPFPPSP